MEKDDRHIIAGWDYLESEDILKLFKSAYKELKRQNLNLLVYSFIPFILALLLIIFIYISTETRGIVYGEVRTIDIINGLVIAIMFGVSLARYTTSKYSNISTRNLKLKYKDGIISNIVDNGNSISATVDVDGITIKSIDISGEMQEKVEEGGKVYVVTSDKGNLTMVISPKSFDTLMDKGNRQSSNLKIGD